MKNLVQTLYKVKYWESNFKVEVWLVEEERFHCFVEEVYSSLYHLSTLSFKCLILCNFLFCVIYLSDNLKSIKVINDLIKNVTWGTTTYLLSLISVKFTFTLTISYFFLEVS